MVDLTSAYLDLKTRKQIRAHLAQNKSMPIVSLQKIFSEKTYSKICSEIKKAKFKIEQEHLTSRCNRAAAHLSVKKILASKEMLEFIKEVTGKQYRLDEAEILKFKHTDYQMRDYPTKTQAELILNCTPKWNEKFGGTITFADKDGNTLQSPHTPNTITIALRPKNISRFITYVNHYAKKKEQIYIIAYLK